MSCTDASTSMTLDAVMDGEAAELVSVENDDELMTEEQRSKRYKIKSLVMRVREELWKWRRRESWWWSSCRWHGGCGGLQEENSWRLTGLTCLGANMMR